MINDLIQTFLADFMLNVENDCDPRYIANKAEELKVLVQVCEPESSACPQA
jgi:hypothetical protein